LLYKKGKLQETRYIGTTKQLGIFLYAIVTDLSIRKLAERFQRSIEIICRVYHKVMRSFLKPGFVESIIQYIPNDTPMPDIIFSNPKLYPYFKDYVRVIDGTKILVSLPVTERAVFKNGHNNLSQNILAVCDFDIRFTDVLVSWEGSILDSALWKTAIRYKAVQVLEGK
jgi:hypothetical protein